MAEEISDNFPVRENGRNPVITRDVNEDRFLRISEENVSLKRHLRKQEDRIRQLATKLVRLIGEKSKRTERDDLLIGEQKNRIDELEAQVNNLRGKLSVARQQLGSHTKLVPGSTRPGRPKSSRSATTTPTLVPDEVTRLLIDAKSENHVLRDQVKHLQDRWQKTNQELMSLREELQVKQVEYQDEIVAVRSQTLLDTEMKQQKLADNIQFIRLQRETKRTASWLATYEAQCRTLETSLNSAKESIAQLELQVSNAQEELRSEQTKCLNLLKQNEENASCSQQLKEANAQLVGLKDENKILKDANEVFLAKSLETVNRSNASDDKENKLNARIDQLEITLKNELKAKSDLISALTQEKAKCLSLDQATQSLDKKCLELAAQLNIAVEQLSEAKNAANVPAEFIVDKEFIVKPCECCPIKELECAELNGRLTQIKSEILKIKELLKIQVDINKDYQEEIEALTQQMASAEALHEKERRELMYIFSDKTHKMAELEQSLETLRQRIPLILSPRPTVPETVPSAPLVDYESSRENFEVENNPEEIEEISVPEAVIANVPYNTASEENMTSDDDDRPRITVKIHQFLPTSKENLPRLFVTWEHETLPRQYSPIVSDGVFNSESEHFVQENFQEVSTSLEVQLHQAVGASDSRPIATGCLKPGMNQSTPMAANSNDHEIGMLLYSYSLENFKEKEPETNNNEPELTNPVIVLPEVAVPRAPVPVPRKFKSISSDLGNSVASKPVADLLEPIQKLPAQVQETTESSSESLVGGKRKSILRRERTPNQNLQRSGKRRVRVNDQIEERNFDSSDGEMLESFEGSEAGQVEISPEDNSYSLGQILTKQWQNDPPISVGQVLEPLPLPIASSSGSFLAESEISVKRRSRRISKQTATEESDEVSSTLSVTLSEAETSRNISDIETISEEAVHEITVEVFHIRFTGLTRVLADPDVKKFFIEYKFLNYSPEDLETDTCLKPPLGRKVAFNFKKKFSIDTKEKRALLKEMISTNKNLQFTLVTEPSDNDTIDCEDMGYAYVSLRDILNSGNDISRKEIPVFDSENLNNEIGALCVSALAFKALNAL